MIELNVGEMKLSSKLSRLKEASGSHSPSIFTLLEEIPDINIKVDACFLSNPYATDLFLTYFKSDLLDTGKIRDVLEFYPSQNEVIAETIANGIGVNKESIFVGNGAIEVIQAVLHNFVKKTMVVNIPTFSSYYEFCKSSVDVIFYKLEKKNNFQLDLDEYIAFVLACNADSVVIINPNNPNGGYISYKDMRYILNKLRSLSNIIIDESFIHFAYENNDFDLLSATDLSKEFPNVIVIKSMSKDFGIAGMRAGYGIMDKWKVRALLSNGYLWNTCGLTEYFFKLYSNPKFKSSYDVVRRKYIKDAKIFFDNLSAIDQIKTYPSMANFALVELLDGSNASDFVSKLLIKYGVYTRTCSDKVGLEGEFVRIASRSAEENKYVVDSIIDMYD